MKFYQSKSYLEEEYVNQRRSCRDIADELGVSPATIHHYLRLFGVPTRSRIEAISKVKKPKVKKTQTVQEFIKKLVKLDKLVAEVVELRELKKALRGEESYYCLPEEAERNRRVADGKRRAEDLRERRRKIRKENLEGSVHSCVGTHEEWLAEIQERFGGKI